MSTVAKRLKECIAMQKKIDGDIKTGNFFSGAGFRIEIYKGGGSGKEPDYYIETGSSELAEELVKLLSKINRDSLLSYRGLAKLKMKELTSALAEFSDYREEVNPRKHDVG
jgi:hypothetical protein